jgi:hypothetical protein
LAIEDPYLTQLKKTQCIAFPQRWQFLSGGSPVLYLRYESVFCT